MENILKRSRRVYKSVKEVAEQFNLSQKQVYRNIKRPEFEDCIAKFGTGCVRVDIDKYFEICQQVFR